MSSTNRGAKRSEKDLYETPSWATELIIRQIVWGKGARVLEPCIGNGAISSALELVPQIDEIEWCELSAGRDFLTWNFGNERFDYVLTNPPFTLAKEFIEKSLELANCVIMLLPLGYFGSEERHDWWMVHKPTAQHALSKRPMFGKNKYGKWGTDSETYAWLVWDKTGRQATGFNWLLPDEKLYKASVKAFKERYEARYLFYQKMREERNVNC